jgi:uracil-DNA glycosylase family 4
MTSIYPTPVPYEGPDSYRLLVVGEAPGGEEIGQGRPFIGKSGQLLRRYLERQGCEVPTNDVKFANLSKYRPKGNKFSLLLDSDELAQGISDLQEEVERVKPNCILALGGWPMWFLTGECGRRAGKPVPGSGIKNYRGSILPAKDEFLNTKVICSYHPSYIERDWKWNPVFFKDLCRAAEDRKFPDLNYPEWEEHIDPPIDILKGLVSETLESKWAAVDIETFPGGTFSCVGWAFRRPDNTIVGVCVTYKRMDLWSQVKLMWESDVPKIFQYGTYDVSFMQHFYSWEIGGFYGGTGWDTYVASANLYPDFPRGLDFLCSIHTRMPYYKTERKVWKEKGDMTILWKYNIKDDVGTLLIAEDQQRLLGELYG